MKRSLWVLLGVSLALAAPLPFAWRYSLELCNTRRQSFVYSPFSTSQALQLLKSAAQGVTRSEVEALLQGDTSLEVGPSPQWTCVNAVYVDRRELFRKNFLPKPQAVDMAAESTLKSMNEWVSLQTHGQIAQLFTAQQINASTRAVLVNAISLEATWERPFDPKCTHDAPFYGEKTSTVAMMSQELVVTVRQGTGWTRADLPFQGGQLMFQLLLPEARDGLSQCLSMMTPQDWDEPGSGDVIRLQMPRFEIASDHNLTAALQFTQPADLSGLLRVGSAFPAVMQKAHVKVDETGARAAAATAALVFRGIPQSLVADHPFLFRIVEWKSHTTLFFGQYWGP